MQGPPFSQETQHDVPNDRGRPRRECVLHGRLEGVCVSIDVEQGFLNDFTFVQINFLDVNEASTSGRKGMGEVV